MKKIFLFILFSQFISHSINAQITSLPSSSAFQSTRNSDASVNETSGKVITGIPIYNYQVGKIQVPISLSYVGNGVKVSQQSNWVGTNWNLNAGGVITRIVNSYPDEQAIQRVFLTALDSVNTANYLPVVNDTRDFRADLFSFSFAGYSGTFYVSNEGGINKAHLINNDAELKIDVDGFFANQNTPIVITTPTGVKYFFGGVDASEKSSALVKSPKRGGGWMVDTDIVQAVSPLATTAFYLFKIENNYTDQILLDYFDDGSKNFILFEQQKQPYSFTPIAVQCLDTENFVNLNASAFHGTIHNSKKIKRIYSPNSNLEVRFNSDILVLPSDGVMPSAQYDDRILKSIQVYNTLISQNVRNIELTHLLPTVGNTLRHRFFLEKVSINNTNSLSADKCEVYKMEYNDPAALPSRFSYAVDMLGYFNNELNTNLIPKDQNPLFDTTFANLAIRTPNLEFALKGALTKMYYPAGGYTKFDYEQPQVKTITDAMETLYTYRNKNGSTSSKTTDSFIIGNGFALPGDPEYDNPTSIVPQGGSSLTINLAVTIPYGTDQHGDKIFIEVTDATTGITQSDYLIMNHNAWSYTKAFVFSLIENHTYTVAMRQDPINPPATENPLEAYASCSFNTYGYLPALGIRIKKITEFSSDQQIKAKRFYYKRAKDLGTTNEDSAIVTYEPDAEEEEGPQVYWCNLGEAAPQSLNVVSLNVDPFSNIFASADNQVEYNCVTISYGGDNFEEGGIEKQFRVEKKKKPTLFHQGIIRIGLEAPVMTDDEFTMANLDNTDGLNGTLLKETVIEKKDTGLFIKSEREYNYELTVDHLIKNAIVVVPFEATYETINYLFDEYPGIYEPTIGTYDSTSYRYNLKSVVSKEYTNPILVNDVNVPLGIITNTTEFEYSALKGLPSKKSVKDSKGKTLINKFYYPVATDITVLVSTGLAEPNITNYTALKDQNEIASPIQVETYVKNIAGVETLLSRSRSIFNNFSGKVLPYKQQAAKGSGTLFGNTVISQYDTAANPIEITQEGQFKKSIIYGYKDKVVIAEVSNADYASVTSTGALPNLKTLSEAVIDITSMNALEAALNAFRTSLYALVPNAQVTTYVYNPTGQLSSVTDARGRKMTNEYDECKRLRLVKDHDGKIIEEYKYNLLNN